MPLSPKFGPSQRRVRPSKHSASTLTGGFSSWRGKEAVSVIELTNEFPPVLGASLGLCNQRGTPPSLVPHVGNCHCSVSNAKNSASEKYDETVSAAIPSSRSNHLITRTSRSMTGKSGGISVNRFKQSSGSLMMHSFAPEPPSQTLQPPGWKLH
jgi:hypothetical protein